MEENDIDMDIKGRYCEIGWLLKRHFLKLNVTEAFDSIMKNYKNFDKLEEVFSAWDITSRPVTFERLPFENILYILNIPDILGTYEGPCEQVQNIFEILDCEIPAKMIALSRNNLDDILINCIQDTVSQKTAKIMNDKKYRNIFPVAIAFYNILHFLKPGAGEILGKHMTQALNKAVREDTADNLRDFYQEFSRLHAANELCFDGEVKVGNIKRGIPVTRVLEENTKRKAESDLRNDVDSDKKRRNVACNGKKGNRISFTKRSIFDIETEPPSGLYALVDEEDYPWCYTCRMDHKRGSHVFNKYGFPIYRKMKDQNRFQHYLQVEECLQNGTKFEPKN